MSESLTKTLIVVATVGVALVILTAWVAGLSWVVMWSWNATLPHVTNGSVPAMSFWRSVGLVLLVHIVGRLLFGGAKTTK